LATENNIALHLDIFGEKSLNLAEKIGAVAIKIHGTDISNKRLFIELLNSVIEKVLPLDYKSFYGDQGVFTYYFINHFSPKITLDVDRKVFVSTYLTSPDCYRVENRKLLYNPTNSKPIFVHDNGWNYGSPKIIERYRLI
jgi:hypothetical protein